MGFYELQVVAHASVCQTKRTYACHTDHRTHSNTHARHIHLTQHTNRHIAHTQIQPHTETYTLHITHTTQTTQTHIRITCRYTLLIHEVHTLHNNTYATLTTQANVNTHHETYLAVSTGSLSGPLTLHSHFPRQTRPSARATALGGA